MAPFLLLLLSLFASPSTADPLYYICGTDNFTSNSTFSSNLNQLISTLDFKATGFANATAIGVVPDRVYGLFLCRRDTDNCQLCVAAALFDIQQFCQNKKDGIVWYEYCQLRYSNQDFLYAPNVTSNIKALMFNTQNFSADQLQRFQIRINDLMGNLINLAVTNTSQFYATGEAPFTAAQILYGSVQCVPHLTVDGCRKCLQQTLGARIYDFYLKGKKGGRTLGMWCNTRYEIYKFYEGTTMLQLSSNQWLSSPSSPTNVSMQNGTHPPANLSHGGKSAVGIIMAIILAVVFVLVLITTACICFWRRRSKMNIHREFHIEEITNVDSLLFDLSTLELATANFSEHNKLGEGGFGSVYLGLLPDGREIAVKRLSAGSRQGLNELKNELILVAKLQHRNLVRLHGICLEEQEKLLVYEYVPNKSLDTILFDPLKSKLLNWVKRYEIIEGIVRGLLYLHEDSQVKIIHRDLKASNILLDADMTPKISDFGLAKLFGVDETHGMTTCVVGTYGYMAPEYIRHGHFSIKSDVFSFGVLVLEIITGRSRNSFFNDELSQNLLSYVWENWVKGTILMIVDPALGKHFKKNEVMRCIQIGLLCVQEDLAQRPRMTEVHVMLNSYSMSLKAPPSPAFFVGSSSINSGTHAPSNKFMPMSPNEVSISELDPR